MIIFIQDIILIIQCYIKEFKNFINFFIMYIFIAESILNYYKLILLLHIITQYVNNLIIII